MGLCTLFHVAHLAGFQAFELVLGHARPGQHTFALDMLGRGGHHHSIHLGAGFQQQRNIQQHDGPIRRRQELFAPLGHQGMHQSFQPRQRAGITGEGFGQRRPIHHATLGGARIGRLDHRRCFAGIKFMDHRIGVEHRNAFGGEQLGGLAFAHADRAGQADDKGPVFVIYRQPAPSPAPRATPV